MKILSITADRDFTIEPLRDFAEEHSDEKMVFLVRGDLLASLATGLPLLEALKELSSDPSPELYPEFALESLGSYFAEGSLGELKCFFLSIPRIPEGGLREALLPLEGLDAAVGVRLLYDEGFGIGYLKEALAALSDHGICELIIEAPIGYHEKDEEPFMELFLEYGEFLKKIEFSTSFLDSLRPVRCPYLSPSSDLSFYKNRDFLLCPYGMKLDGAVDGKQIRKTLLSTRLKDFADRNRRFRCDDCVAIMDGLSARAAGMEVKK